MVVNGLGLRVEQGVEQGDHALARQAVGALGEAAQIRGPQHGADLLAGTAANLALQHLRAGLGAQIGIEHVAGDRSLAEHVDQDGQALRYACHVGEFRFREAAGAVGHIGDHVVARAMRAGNRQCQIIGGALRLEVVQNGEIEHRVGSFDPAPQGFAAHDHAPDRVVLVADPVGQLVRDQRQEGLARAAKPQEGGAEVLRMQRAGVQRHAQQRQAGRQHAPSELVERANPRRDPACRAYQPFGDRIEAVVGRALGSRPLDHLDGRHEARIDVHERGPGISHGAVVPARRANRRIGRRAPASPCRPPRLRCRSSLLIRASACYSSCKELGHDGIDTGPRSPCPT